MARAIRDRVEAAPAGAPRDRHAGREKAKRERKRRRRRSVPGTSEDAARRRRRLRPRPKPSKDDIAREALVPLEEGERPLVVTIAAVIATGMAVSTIVLFALGVEVQGSEARNAGTLPYAALMGAMAIGLWRARYWAVLGFQTLLALLIVIWSLLLREGGDRARRAARDRRSWRSRARCSGSW